MKTYTLTNDVLILFLDGERIDSYHRLACPDWNVVDFREWAIRFLNEYGY